MNRAYIVRHAKRGFCIWIDEIAYELPKEFRDTHELKIFQDEQGFYLVSSCKKKCYLSPILGYCKAADLRSFGFIGNKVSKRRCP